MDETAYIDLEKEIADRAVFIEDFFDKLNDVVWVLSKFCERADWLMAREKRISLLMAEVHIAATEMENIMRNAEVFDQSMGEMLLLSNSRKLPPEYYDVRKQLQSILPRILLYCRNELTDISKLLMISEEENEPTKVLNRHLLRTTTDLFNNFSEVSSKLFFHIDNAFKRFEEVNDTQMKDIYNKLYMRYCNDNVQSLQEYADDVDDVSEAKHELKELFSKQSLRNIYERNKGKPHLLIREMRQQCFFENHLVEIFAYKAKMEKLRGMTKTAKEAQPQYVVQGPYYDIHDNNEVNLNNNKQ